MGFLKHIRSRSKVKAEEAQKYNYSNEKHGTKPDRASRLPQVVLKNIFYFVCPHALDESYLSSEDSMVEDGCMLCDMRDLAACAQVCSRWNTVATPLLYRSVRIDAVHYCAREIELAEKRKRRSFFDRNGDPKDAPTQRLQLFARTVRQSDTLRLLVLFLKMPYMTRETCKAEVAKIVSVLPNLRYVDLPDGFFSDDASCVMLRHELQGRCPDIRRMRYIAGAERSLLDLARLGFWQGLQAVELSHVNVEIGELLRILGSLPVLSELKIDELPWLDDTVFQSTVPPAVFPPLEKLALIKTPNVTATGLAAYLSRPEVRENLTSLSLTSTGVAPATLHTILKYAPYLIHLSITEAVSRSFATETGNGSTPLLTSSSLQILYYEITSAADSHGLTKPHNSYYDYLAKSLWSGSLPALCTLYVRDINFPESLVERAPLSPPPKFGGMSINTAAANAVEWKQHLDIYTKGLDELEWKFIKVGPSAESYGGRNGMSSPSLLRPLTSYGLSPQWGGEARKSMVVGNGFGGFLAVPDERSSSSAGDRRSRADIWR